MRLILCNYCFKVLNIFKVDVYIEVDRDVCVGLFVKCDSLEKFKEFNL